MVKRSWGTHSLAQFLPLHLPFNLDSLAPSLSLSLTLCLSRSGLVSASQIVRLTMLRPAARWHEGALFIKKAKPCPPADPNDSLVFWHRNASDGVTLNAKKLGGWKNGLRIAKMAAGWPAGWIIHRSHITAPTPKPDLNPKP